MSTIRRVRAGEDQGGGDAAVVRLNPLVAYLPAARLVIRGPDHVRLGLAEARCLECLLARPGTIVPMDELVRHVWGEGLHIPSYRLHQLIYRLRRLVEMDVRHPRQFRNFYGEGYMFIPFTGL